MKSDQREIRDIVIKCHLLTPARRVVASLASRPELTLVRIIRLVTRDARRCELVLIEIALVTALTFNARVSPIERELRGLRVVEVDRRPLG
jgi:hypothetical protein